MATTLTAVVTDGERFALAHIGDSRGYVFRDGSLERVTTDHTVVQRLVDDGTLHPEDVSRHPWRHLVLRTLGGDDGEGRDDVGDVRSIDLRAGDRVLLASDGLTDLVSERRLEAVLARHPDDVAIGLLVDAALSGRWPRQRHLPAGHGRRGSGRVAGRPAVRRRTRPADRRGPRGRPVAAQCLTRVPARGLTPADSGA